jgi:uncharacterized protein
MPGSECLARLDGVKMLLWRGLDFPLMELARVHVTGSEMRASGTQIGETYELRYVLEPGLLELELVGERRLEVPLGDLDFFDLGNSPLFNSLPVLRDGLLQASGAHDYVMRWVSVPELEIDESRQRYEPLGGGVVRFSSGSFQADIEFDDNGFVLRYPRLAERIGHEP